VRQRHVSVINEVRRSVPSKTCRGRTAIDKTAIKQLSRVWAKFEGNFWGDSKFHMMQCCTCRS